MSEPTKEQVQELADAMWQLLDDMRDRGTSVCLAAKAQARIAYEPFVDAETRLAMEQGEYSDWMTLEQAESILRECE